MDIQTTGKSEHTNREREPLRTADEREAPTLVAFLRAPAESLDSILVAVFWEEGERG
jgi:hypothetical protein